MAEAGLKKVGTGTKTPVGGEDTGDDDEVMVLGGSCVWIAL